MDSPRTQQLVQRQHQLHAAGIGPASINRQGLHAGPPFLGAQRASGATLCDWKSIHGARDGYLAKGSDRHTRATSNPVFGPAFEHRDQAPGIATTQSRRRVLVCPADVLCEASNSIPAAGQPRPLSAHLVVVGSGGPHDPAPMGYIPALTGSQQLHKRRERCDCEEDKIAAPADDHSPSSRRSVRGFSVEVEGAAAAAAAAAVTAAREAAAKAHAIASVRRAAALAEQGDEYHHPHPMKVLASTRASPARLSTGSGGSGASIFRSSCMSGCSSSSHASPRNNPRERPRPSSATRSATGLATSRRPALRDVPGGVLGSRLGTQRSCAWLRSHHERAADLVK